MVKPVSGMIRDIQTGLIILHPPKTGGTSIRRALENLNRAEYLEYHNHQTAEQCAITEPTLISVRHPMQRLYSNYNHLLYWCKKSRQWQKQQYLEDLGIDSFAQCCWDLDHRRIVANRLEYGLHHWQGTWRPQTLWMNPDTEWHRLEDHTVWPRLGIPKWHVKHRPWDLQCSPSTEQSVLDYFKKDLDTFGY